VADVTFSAVVHDFASRKFRAIGDAALLMAAKVEAANTAMANGFERNTQAARGWFYLILYGAPLIPPLLAAIGASAGGMLAAVTSATPGILALGGALVGLGVKFKKSDQAIKQAQAKVASASSPKTKAAAEKNLKSVTAAQNAGQYGKAYRAYGETKQAVSQAVDKAQSVTIPIAITGMDIIQKTLPKLQPIIKSFGDVAEKDLKKVSDAMDGPGFQKFLNWVRTVGAINFDNLLQSLGNLAVTVGNLGMAFSGEGVGFTNWLKDVTAKWKNWSATLSTSKGFQKFLDYVHTNMPLIGQVLRNLTKILSNFIQGLAPLGHIVLDGLVHLTNVMAKISPGTWNKIATAILALATASKVLSAASKVQAQIELVQTLAKKWGQVKTAEEGAATASAAGKIPGGGWVLAMLALLGTFIYTWKKTRETSSAARAAQDRDLAILRGSYKHLVDFVVPLYNSFNGWYRKYFNGLGKPTSAWGDLAKRVFRSVGQGALATVAPFAKMASMILSAEGHIAQGWANMLRALSHVPGFGWARGAADAMQNAANKAYALKASIDRLYSKAVTVTTHFVMTRTTINSVVNKNAGDPRLGSHVRAAGGPVWPGNDYLVGELGPEMVRFGTAGTVIPHKDIRTVSPAGDGGKTTRHNGDQVIQVHLHLGTRTIIRELKAQAKLEGITVAKLLVS
jgi:hypothetical protein